MKHFEKDVSAEALKTKPKKPTPAQNLVLARLRGGAKMFRGVVGTSVNTRGSRTSFAIIVARELGRSGSIVSDRVVEALETNGWVMKLPWPKDVNPFSSQPVETHQISKLGLAQLKGGTK